MMANLTEKIERDFKYNSCQLCNKKTLYTVYDGNNYFCCDSHKNIYNLLHPKNKIISGVIKAKKAYLSLNTSEKDFSEIEEPVIFIDKPGTMYSKINRIISKKK